MILPRSLSLCHEASNIPGRSCSVSLGLGLKTCGTEPRPTCDGHVMWAGLNCYCFQPQGFEDNLLLQNNLS